MNEMKKLSLGHQREYNWIEFSSTSLKDVLAIVPEVVLAKYLVITAFDSGSLVLTQEEKQRGWANVGNLTISPKLNSVDIPIGEYDEWYIYPSSPKINPNTLEIFVNYTGFSLSNPRSRLEHLDPTWDKSLALAEVEQAIKMQQRFWSQLHENSPETYIANGDRLILVSRNEGILEKLKQ